MGVAVRGTELEVGRSFFVFLPGTSLEMVPGPPAVTDVRVDTLAGDEIVGVSEPCWTGGEAGILLSEEAKLGQTRLR